MDQILLLLAVFVGGLIVGWISREQFAVLRINKIIDEFDQQNEKLENDNRIFGRIENNNGIFYMFKVDDGSFLAQGDTHEALSDALRQRFPGKIFLLKKEEFECLGDKDVTF